MNESYPRRAIRWTRDMRLGAAARPAAVVLSPAAFDRLSYRARFVAAVEEGLEDIAEGRVLSDNAVGVILDERFFPRAADPKGDD